ncbi:hypothetical protein [Neobacillus sp. CF12]|uniref:hypothetical protein n=1 Tax=Neobacillus sp. CF12 TaxID=3055864 RepID=UPI0025A25477|nr:hypothetical protein [Neobacillus sp. CF12]MDM5327138.1 hypothetical protein [Neobacillus sp. CF12]
MRKKFIWSIVVFVLLISFYEVMVRGKTVTYMGEDENWRITINSKIKGLNSSYTVVVKYKGIAEIEQLNFNIHPHYEAGLPVLDKDGYYIFECKNECTYYDKESKLLLFMIWKEKNHSIENMDFIELRKMNK